jgi:hypothetical protein
MKTTRCFSLKQCSSLAAAIALCLGGASLHAAVTPAQVVESKLQGGTILTAKADALAVSVHDCVKENPLRAGAVVEAVLIGGRADADALAPKIVVAAIEGLGPKPSSTAIASIVHFAVKATPAVVLEIVRAAVKASPKEAVEAIVVAAVKGVPNPKENVSTLTGPRKKTGFDKDAQDGKGSREAANDADKDLLPITEAIAQVAHEVSGQDFASLLTAANGAATGGTTGVGSVYYGYYWPPLEPLMPNISTGVPQTTVVSQ